MARHCREPGIDGPGRLSETAGATGLGQEGEAPELDSLGSKSYMQKQEPLAV